MGNLLRIQSYIRDHVRRVNTNPLLAAMQNAQLTPEQWMVWGLSRWRLSWAFERFLFGAIQQAKRAQLPSLVNTLLLNFNDEMGSSAPSNNVMPASHEAWRRRFYGALDVDYKQMKIHVSSAYRIATQYCALLEQILLLEVPLTTAGALWFLEVEIPGELIFVSEGCASLGLSADDMQWVADHVSHDPAYHAAGLQQVIGELAGDDKCKLTLVLEGVDRATQAKALYFQGVIAQLGL